MSELPNIVLVHGAWADRSSWSAVVERLRAEGYSVLAPQFPETSLADDVARLRQVLNRQSGPTIVVGHSYGGRHLIALGVDAPNITAPVKALVMYVVQKALSMSTFEEVMGVPAWKSHPTWYLVAAEAQAIPPDA